MTYRHFGGGRCHHRAHGCGQSMTLAGWALLLIRLKLENHLMERYLRTGERS